jgi:peptidylamidoglycolate lyase
MTPRSLSRVVVVLTALGLSAGAPRAPRVAADEGRTAAASSYHVVHGWPLVPAGELLGQVSGVAVDSRGNVLVFRRADRSTPPMPTRLDPIHEPAVLLFDGATGRLLDRWGAERFVTPHGLTIDRDDNVWLTDLVLHQVFKCTHAGAQLLALGVRATPGNDRDHFDQPTDVAIGADGAVYVADGYGNSRVVQFTPEGRYVREWGRKGTGPGEFAVPHSIAVDREGHVYVADRGNARVQIFDAAGKFLREWRSPALGRPWAVRAGADGFLYVVDGGDLAERPPDRARVLKVDSRGEVVASFGAFGNYDGQFIWAHCVATDPGGAVYVGDVSVGRRIQKFVP